MITTYVCGDDGVRFDKLPFITGVRNDVTLPEGLAEYLPFRLGFDPQLGIISQEPSPGVDQQLDIAYRSGSMLSTPLGRGNVNPPLVEEILGLIETVTGGSRGKAFFEPGCGLGYLLRQLIDRGAANVLGCEPGEQATGGTEEFGVPIQRDVFRPEEYATKFDCVYHYGVLEHVADPSAFLAGNAACLRPGGMVLAMVPGCDEDLELGNISMLAHEHKSYFTDDSLVGLFRRLGFEDVGARRLAFSRGILAVWGRTPASGTRPALPPDEVASGRERARLAQFARRLGDALTALQARADALERRGGSLGLYGAPTLVSGLLSFAGTLRCFDGDAAKHGLRFSGFPGVIEAPQRLVDEPVDELWVLPIYHDAAIRGFLERLLPADRRPHIVSMLGFLRAA